MSEPKMWAMPIRAAGTLQKWSDEVDAITGHRPHVQSEPIGPWSRAFVAATREEMRQVRTMSEEQYGLVIRPAYVVSHEVLL